MVNIVRKPNKTLKEALQCNKNKIKKHCIKISFNGTSNYIIYNLKNLTCPSVVFALKDQKIKRFETKIDYRIVTYNHL